MRDHSLSGSVCREVWVLDASRLLVPSPLGRCGEGGRHVPPMAARRRAGAHSAPQFDFVSYIFTLTERASLSYSVRKIALSAGELLLLCSPPCRPLPLPIPLILDPRHCCVRELLYGPALGRLEPRGRVAVTRSPRAIALRAPGLPARPEPPLVEHLGAAAREVLDRHVVVQRRWGDARASSTPVSRRRSRPC